MYPEQSPEPTGWQVPTTSDDEPPKGQKLRRTGVGALALVIVGSILYGPNLTFTAIFFLTICTAGFGLIPMLFASWLTGLVVLAVWDAVRAAAGRTGPTLPLDAGGS